jgi:tetratricopeptide (TPR) repeat protein
MPGFGNRFTLMVGVALLLVAGSLAFAPAVAHLNDAPAPLADPASVVSTGVSPSGYADRVIANAQTRLQQFPTDDRAFTDLGLAYLQKARETNDPAYYSQAETALKQALAQNAGNADALGAMGSLALSRHAFREALDWGVKAHTAAPNKAYPYGVIADAQTELGQYDAAVATLDKMVHTRPDLSSYSRISYARELHGDVDGAIAAMQQAAEAGGPAPENVSWVQVQLGNLYFNAGRLGEAEHAYQAALAAYPDYLHALAGMGQVRAAQGKPAEAIAYYKQAVAAVPLPQYLQALGDLYTAQGDTAAAQTQYDTVRQIFVVFAAGGVNVDAERAAFLADTDSEPAEAVRLAQAAIATRDDIHTWDTLAWAQYRAGQVADAQKSAAQALRLGTRNPLILFHAGMIAAKAGDSANARQWLGQVLAINPQFNVKYAPQAQATLAGLGK